MTKLNGYGAVAVFAEKVLSVKFNSLASPASGVQDVIVAAEDILWSTLEVAEDGTTGAILVGANGGDIALYFLSAEQASAKKLFDELQAAQVHHRVTAPVTPVSGKHVPHGLPHEIDVRVQGTNHQQRELGLLGRGKHSFGFELEPTVTIDTGGIRVCGYLTYGAILVGYLPPGTGAPGKLRQLARELIKNGHIPIVHGEIMREETGELFVLLGVPEAGTVDSILEEITSVNSPRTG
jgi:hypothetical protein